MPYTPQYAGWSQQEEYYELQRTSAKNLGQSWQYEDWTSGTVQQHTSCPAVAL
ncbi:hypothetical protein FIBSPDRAFT_862690 [Athelia psychrophila]|uniref:Uncharacterized protein n=1 Tax=Athelia psychrophila TaxID=1759441 RepID=A0A166I886_9AGAM|nr:hypothetical protein FIBSPDRAFT_862690 [Fibularhizoctonia sp. CBS 109695]